MHTRKLAGNMRSHCPKKNSSKARAPQLTLSWREVDELWGRVISFEIAFPIPHRRYTVHGQALISTDASWGLFSTRLEVLYKSPLSKRKSLSEYAST